MAHAKYSASVIQPERFSADTDCLFGASPALRSLVRNRSFCLRVFAAPSAPLPRSLPVSSSEPYPIGCWGLVWGDRPLPAGMAPWILIFIIWPSTLPVNEFFQGLPGELARRGKKARRTGFVRRALPSFRAAPAPAGCCREPSAGCPPHRHSPAASAWLRRVLPARQLPSPLRP